MTTETVLQFIMGFSAMTAAAGRDVLPDGGRMSLVALHAGNLGFMSATVGGNVSRRLSVTLDTVVIAEFSRQAERS